MKKLFFLIISFNLFLFTCCKKDTTAPIDFSHYTVTDNSCAIAGEVDNTDWTYDNSWNETETALFAFRPNISTFDSAAGTIEISPLCPNPNDGFFTISINAERECKLKIVCVNTDMRALYYTAKPLASGTTTDTFDFRSFTAFHKNENYRMYYAFYTATDSLYYIGHGDFRVE